MVAYGFAGGDLSVDLAIGNRIGARVVEILPDWRALPDPKPLRGQVADAGLLIHSAHGCWGGQSIRAPRVDLGEVDARVHADSVDDLKRCVDWLSEAGGTFLVVHPGGLSAPEQAEARRDALARGLVALADHAKATGVALCVENMPPGVHPGSRMADLAALVAEIDRPEVALALDTGHANLTATPRAETLAAGRWLRTTHVHDNDGRQDTHHPPGLGTVDWDDWVAALDAINYSGPVMLECIRHLRRFPESISPGLLERLRRLTCASST
jgi:sugar phosphate isomerase/epimerase